MAPSSDINSRRPKRQLWGAYLPAAVQVTQSMVHVAVALNCSSQLGPSPSLFRPGITAAKLGGLSLPVAV